ncbi:PREDICTED: ataxin-10 [Nicrophorus vespilloides]|uniref:Ataxin-10 n=1 Tax=Nicrophorus vespilloides TaxID=110193 RepID=A0ABM1MQK6_NICVS|nr:PREDICTED: ataxin-10 [Nicrophorus vespilloides]
MHNSNNMALNVVIDHYNNTKDRSKLVFDLTESYCIKNITRHVLPLNITVGEVNNIGKLLQELCQEENLDWTAIQLLLKCLRNGSILNKHIQNCVVDNESIVKNMQQLLQAQQKLQTDCLKALVIFMLNVTVDNGYSGKKIWLVFKNDLMDLLAKDLCVSFTLAVIYNVLARNKQIEPSLELINEVLRLMEIGFDSEYILFLLEQFITYMHKYHRALRPEYRQTVLLVLKYLIPKEDLEVPKEYVLLLVDDFKKKSDCILKTVTEYLDQIEPAEVAHLLDVLVSLSCIEKYLSYIHNDRSFLINCAFLLKSMHLAGKNGQNKFTAISKLSDEAKADNNHPAFGFKASVIRILGNLAWKSRSNQDELRELECIPLLLDCCNIDERNPFIMQMVIFAIRNLCEKNELNQALINAMNKKGTVDSATLNKLGITLDDGSNPIRIAPFNSA